MQMNQLFTLNALITAILLGMLTAIVFSWGNTTRWWDWETDSSESEGFYSDSDGHLWHVETGSYHGVTWYRASAQQHWSFVIGDKFDSNDKYNSQPHTNLPSWVTDRFSSDYHTVTICERGWPARSFLSVAYGNIILPGRWSRSYELGMDDSSESITFSLGSRKYTLPLTPRWGGLIFDTLFFGCGLYLLYSVLILIVQPVLSNSRIKHDICPNCRYCLQGLRDPGCPECGWNRSESDKSAEPE